MVAQGNLPFPGSSSSLAMNILPIYDFVGEFSSSALRALQLVYIPTLQMQGITLHSD